MQRTRRKVLGLENSLDLQRHLQVPELFKKDLVKCRVLYASTIEKVEFHPYQILPVRSLKIVQDDSISYLHKYEDRTALTQLFHQKGICDDIIIVKNGFVTDSYYANLVFDDDKQLFTPRKPLLEGVRRAKLLEAQIIEAADIRVADFAQFERIHLVNAMMKLGECVVEIENIVL